VATHQFACSHLAPCAPSLLAPLFPRSPVPRRATPAPSPPPLHVDVVSTLIWCSSIVSTQRYISSRSGSCTLRRVRAAGSDHRVSSSCAFSALHAARSAPAGRPALGHLQARSGSRPTLRRFSGQFSGPGSRRETAAPPLGRYPHRCAADPRDAYTRRGNSLSKDPHSGALELRAHARWMAGGRSSRCRSAPALHVQPHQLFPSLPACSRQVRLGSSSARSATATPRESASAAGASRSRGGSATAAAVASPCFQATPYSASGSRHFTRRQSCVNLTQFRRLVSLSAAQNHANVHYSFRTASGHTGAVGIRFSTLAFAVIFAQVQVSGVSGLGSLSVIGADKESDH